MPVLKGVGRKISRGVHRKKDRKIAKNDRKIASIYYICTMFENPGGHGLPTPAADVHASAWTPKVYYVFYQGDRS